MPCRVRYSTSGLEASPCTPCIPGTITFQPGTASCISVYETCERGLQPKAPGIETLLNAALDCVPLICPPPLIPSVPSGSSCVGAGSSFFSPPLQTPLATGSVTPLLLLAAPRAPCVAASTLPVDAPPRSLLTSAPGFADLTNVRSSPWDILVASAITAGGGGLLLYGLLRVPLCRRECRGCKRQPPERALGAFRCCDFVSNIATVDVPPTLREVRREVSKSKQARKGAGGDVPQGAPAKEEPSPGGAEGGDLEATDTDTLETSDRRKTALGGLCTFLLGITLCSLGAWTLLSFANDNTTQTSSTQLLTSDMASLMTNSSGWAPPSSPIRAALGGSLRPTTGIQVRVFGQSANGCAAPAPFVTQGTPSSSFPFNGSSSPLFSVAPGEEAQWVLDLPTATTGAACGPGGAAPGLSLFTLSCLSCRLSSSSFVSLYLPFTCQSALVEIVSVDAFGVVSAVGAPMGVPAGTPDGTYLATFSISSTVSLVTLEDNRELSKAQGLYFRDSPLSGQKSTFLGLKVVVGKASSSTFTPSRDNQGSGIYPLANAVVLSVDLGLEPNFSRTVLTSKTTYQALVAQLIGLLGIMAVYKCLFLAARVLKKKGRGILSGRPQQGGHKEEAPLRGLITSVVEGLMEGMREHNLLAVRGARGGRGSPGSYSARAVDGASGFSETRNGSSSGGGGEAWMHWSDDSMHHVAPGAPLKSGTVSSVSALPQGSLPAPPLGAPPAPPTPQGSPGLAVANPLHEGAMKRQKSAAALEGLPRYIITAAPSLEGLERQWHDRSTGEMHAARAGQVAAPGAAATAKEARGGGGGGGAAFIPIPADSPLRKLLQHHQFKNELPLPSTREFSQDLPNGHRIVGFR